MKIRSGKVVVRAPAIRSVTASSPNEMMAAKMAPATIPGRSSGSVTRQKVCKGVAPRFWAARSSAGSRLCTLIDTSRTVKGSVTTRCPSISPTRESISPRMLK